MADIAQIPTTAKIRWPEGINLGVGVSYPGGEILGQAVEPFEVHSGDTVTSDFTVDRVETQHQAESLLTAGADFAFTTGAASAKAHTEMSRELKFSASELTIVLSVRFQWEEPAVASPYPKLTKDAAAALKRDVREFRARYGDYFIAGYTKQAHFTVFMHIASEDREERNKLALAVEGSVTTASGKFTGDVKTEIENHMKNHKATLTVHGSMTGVPGVKGRVATTLDEIPALYATFEQATGTRQTAHLVHYHLIDPRMPAEIPVSPEVLREAESLYDRLASARVQLSQIVKGFTRGLDDSRARDLQTRFEEIERDVEHRLPRTLECPLELVLGLSQRLSTWTADASRVQDYQYLWASVSMGKPVTEPVGHASVHPLPKWSHAESWEPGHEGHIDTKAEFRQDGVYYSHSHGSSPWHGPTGPDTAWAMPGGKVCGYRVRSLRPSHHGSCKVSGGGLGKESIEFSQHSEYDRGVNHEIAVYYVPADEVKGFNGA